MSKQAKSKQKVEEVKKVVEKRPVSTGDRVDHSVSRQHLAMKMAFAKFDRVKTCQKNTIAA